PFAPGFNVLTGETGAGKSILVDAILLLRGARAQTDVIRVDAETATVEAVFEVSDGAVATLDEAGLPLEDGEVVIRRELSRSGRRQDLVRFQGSELDAARVRVGEDDELRTERRRLQHAERFAAGLQEVGSLLHDDAASATARLARAGRVLSDLGRLDPAFAAPAETLDAARAHVEDTLAAVRGLRDTRVLEPGRLEGIDERLDALTRLKRKYGDSEEVLLRFRA